MQQGKLVNCGGGGGENCRPKEEGQWKVDPNELGGTGGMIKEEKRTKKRETSGGKKNREKGGGPSIVR